VTVTHISAERNTRCNMNTKKLIGTSMIALLVVAMGAGMAAAYVIDGDLTDWGVAVDDGGDWALNATWVPDGHDSVQFQIEDNVDPDSATSWDGGSLAAYATGVHITGTALSYGTYDEARVVSGSRAGWAFPTGGTGMSAEKYDMEAMYVDDTDDNYLYFAIVLSHGPGSIAGDLGLNLDGSPGYEIGIEIHSGGGNVPIYNVSDWELCTTIPDSSPWRINTATAIRSGTANVSYIANGPDPEPPSSGYPATYIIEGEIPWSAIGGKQAVTLLECHYTCECGNDEIGEIPEFAVLAVPVFALMGLVFLMRRKKN